MTDELRIGLQELLRKAQMEYEADFLRESVRAMSQALMELEVDEHIVASRHERTPERTGVRNGYRGRQWDTRGWTPWSSEFQGCATAATSLRFLSPEGKLRGHYLRGGLERAARRVAGRKALLRREVVGEAGKDRSAKNRLLRSSPVLTGS